MKLQKLLENIEYKLIKGSLDIEINDIIYDSRKVIDNTLFIALKGYNVDGHKYIKDAISKGANCIVVEQEVEILEDITVIQVDNTRNKLALISKNYLNQLI